jgi:nitroreductase
VDFINLAKQRFSARKYQEKPVESEKLEKVLSAGRVAPSAHNKQPWHYIVVQQKETKEKICETYQYKWLLKAPAIIVICGDHEASWKRDDGKDHCDIDIALTLDHMMLQAAEIGLGTCCVCMFDAQKCHEIFDLPENIEVVALLPIGYSEKEPDINRHDSMRRNINEIVHWDKW